ncbi:hypothetical protein [Actinomycetospora termitidis]|uniref:Uncharacterized protein n=1 Tax=Actinomycetospora termitidis TaxID=3053470 RepID=A0ABT7MHT3_9PSEU|nr:hypothetical protein [Actinomycetospora sp. Odt1-22]MDL5160237.1 hypothetical protein [Actinomycetospora sp. Odt1-22]
MPGTCTRVPGADVAVGSSVPALPVAVAPGPVVVVTASDDPGGASVDGDPRVGIGQPSGTEVPVA